MTPMTRPLVLIVVLASLESLQAQSSATIPAAVQALRTAHAQALISVANQALDLRLVNDAERLQLEAGWWDSARPELKSLDERHHALLLASIREDKGVIGEFWKSSAYDTTRAKFLRTEAGARRSTLRTITTQARGAKQDLALLDALARLALDLDLPEDATFASLMGAERTQRVRGEWEREHSLESVTLGELVAGAPIDLKSLRGKVVLWRSFSL